MNNNKKSFRLTDLGFTKLSKQQLSALMGGNENEKTNPPKNDCGNNNQKNGPITSPITPGGTPLDICIEQ
ncbi:MAG TPA: hypothetical protein DCS93_17135 [Microscillaceae bacterium]|nr:hypothetical protein [Microscillaceae bacterium]